MRLGNTPIRTRVGRPVHIDIWSDVICPWCYLGARRLDGAIERFRSEHPDTEVTVRFRAFELDPGAPPGVTDLRTAIDTKYGPGAFDSMTERLVELGGPEGIAYRFDIAKRVNTFDAHRMLSWAASLDRPPTASVDPNGGSGDGAQLRLAERVFRAYFTEGADVSAHSVLVGLAGAVGLDADAAGEVLASGAFADEVRDDESAARDRAITGVPGVVIDDRVLVPGAQEVDTFLRVMNKVAGDLP